MATWSDTGSSAWCSSAPNKDSLLIQDDSILRDSNSYASPLAYNLSNDSVKLLGNKLSPFPHKWTKK